MLNIASHKAKLLRPSGEAPSPTTTFLFDHEEEDRRGRSHATITLRVGLPSLRHCHRDVGLVIIHQRLYY